MREILFRGKRVDNGEWVYGYYCPVVRGKFPATPCIVPDCDGVWEGIPIIPETVGQYTGLETNGQKIFEGDIVSTPYYKGVVIYNDNDVGGGAYCVKHGIEDPAIDIVMNDFDVFVIGNVTDNPELLEVSE